MIAQLSDFYRPKIDGVSISLETLLNEFHSRKVEFDLFVPKWPESYSDLENTYRFLSQPTPLYPDMRFSIPVNAKSLRRLVRTDYSVIHSHTPGSMGFLAVSVAKLRRIPHFHTFHGYFRDYRHYIKLFGRTPREGVIDTFSKWWANQADYLIVPTEKVSHWLEEIGVNSEIRVIPYGLDLQKFYRKQEQKERYLVDKGWVSEGDFVVLYVGRLAQEKSVDVLIRDFAAALQKCRSLNRAKMVIVGDGPARKELAELVSSLGIQERVVLTGFVPAEEIDKVYKSADVFSFLSTSETQGIVIIEAMASGLPVLLSDDDAYRKLIINGENGFVVNSEYDFTKGLEVLTGDWANYQQFSRRSVELSRHFDVKVVADQVIDYYQYATEKWQVDKELHPHRVTINLRRVIEQGKKIRSDISRVISKIA